MHVSADDGCAFTLIECPFAQLGCQPQMFFRKDLSQHMTEGNTRHMRVFVGRLKQVSCQLEAQERRLNELQERFALFTSHALGNVSCVRRKTENLALSVEMVTQRLGEMEKYLSKTRPQSLKRQPKSLKCLDQALDDTFPSLNSFGLEGNVLKDSSINESLLQGLREIEGWRERRRERAAKEGERRERAVREEEEEGKEEEAGLPQAGTLPKEEGKMWREKQEEEEEREKKEEEEENREREPPSHTTCSDSLQSMPTSNTSYATAVSTPLCSNQKCSHFVQTNKPKLLAQNPILAITHGNQAINAARDSTHHLISWPQTRGEGEPLQGMSGAVARLGQAGWINWSDESLPCTPRSESCCSVRSSSSSGEDGEG